MPYVFTHSLFPAEKSTEIAKIYIDEIKKWRPQFKETGKEIIPNAVKSTVDGMEVIGVYDIKEGKLEDFLLLQQKAMVAYHKIAGFRYKIETWFKVTEALEMIGLKAPE